MTFLILTLILLVGVITRAISMGANAAVLIFTLWATVGISRFSQRAKTKASLVTTLIRNGKHFWGDFTQFKLTYHFYCL